ncbi:MAG: hypothetical protein M3Y93_07840, partial [Pseudomonadota bacterium]|nr:hypothetical protein [Pseudomonadota bacterium]
SVSTALGTEPSSLRLVAAHTWDTLGALAAGWRAALVARAGNAALPVGEQPDIIEKNLRQQPLHGAPFHLSKHP